MATIEVKANHDPINPFTSVTPTIAAVFHHDQASWRSVGATTTQAYFLMRFLI
jgi:hypothetical protein